MIHKLRWKFIRIAMASVTLVTVLMALSINVVNFLSSDNELEHTLEMISENAGKFPQPFPSERPGPKREERFSMEKPYSTRYFVLRYTGDGSLTQAEMNHIAAVTEADAGAYLAVALKHGEGFGYTGTYKYYVVSTGGGQYMAIFLDCYNELHALRTVALISLLGVVGCVALVFILVLVLSRRAITPVIESAEVCYLRVPLAGAGVLRSGAGGAGGHGKGAIRGHRFLRAGLCPWKSGRRPVDRLLWRHGDADGGCRHGGGGHAGPVPDPGTAGPPAGSKLTRLP